MHEGRSAGVEFFAQVVQVCAEHKKPKKLMKHLGQIKVHQRREVFHQVKRQQALLRKMDLHALNRFFLKAMLGSCRF